MKILVTSFDPFGIDIENSSLEVLKLLPDSLDNIQLDKQILPTQFIEGPRLLLDILDKKQPDALLLLGQAGGRSQITFERVAINCMNARIQDNAGYAPHEMPVIKDGPAAYFTNIPLASLIEYLQELWLPAGISNSAGTFVCNCLFYQAMHYIMQKKLPCLCDFVHLPYLSGQSGIPEDSPSLPPNACLSVLVKTIRYLSAHPGGGPK